MKIKLLKTGEIVKVKGDPPEKPGDRFVGVDMPAPAQEKPKAKNGCRLFETKTGGRAFECSRGKTDDGPPPPRERSFRFDPKLHEKLKG